MHDLDPLSRAAAERLRALPDETAEPYGWEEFRRRASFATRGAARPFPAAALGLKAAAAIVLLAGATALAAWMWGGTAMWGGSARWGGPAQPADLSTDTGRRSAVAPVSESVGRSGESAGRSGETDVRTDPTDVRARVLERWLAHQPAVPAMVRVGAYATEAPLEDRIAQLDDLLTTARAEGVQSEGLSSLEEQRSRLVRSLAQVRFAETLVADSPR